MSSKNLSFIALRVLSDDCTGKKNLEVNKYYCFQKGVTFVDETHIDVSSQLVKELKEGTVFDEYICAAGRDDLPSVSITAIVGKNGSGKSSIIEMVMRLINNFATSTFGENPPTNKAVERLRYIDGIQAELYYLLDNNIYRLKVQYRNVCIDEYNGVIEDEKDKSMIYVQNVTSYYDNGQSNFAEETIYKMPAHPSRALRLKEHIETLQGFFYTLVHNYSIHAYNTNDYKKECCSVEYERMVQDRKTGFANPDERCWLRGLFHKNDGYQRPMVIAPYRDQGTIYIESEDALMKDRFIGLLLSTEGFRTLNGHLQVTGIEVKRNSKTYGLDYLKGRKSVTYTKFYPNLTKAGYEKFRTEIVKYWSVCIEKELTSYKGQRKYYELAIDYLVCKTLKIAAQYAQFNAFYTKHYNVKSKIDSNSLERLVKALYIDKSHITKKIRQTLAYIVFGIYETEQWNSLWSSLDKAKIEVVRILTSQTNEKAQFVDELDELAPPSFFDVKINLVDTYTNEAIELETLSSGEKQQIFTISSILYHLQNLQSVFRDNNKTRVAYSHACVIMEEIELYYHPELQQQFIKYLLDGIRQVKLKGIEALYFIVVTHSPFVLSDIPTDKILALDKDNKEANIVRSFAANIHEILKTGFFLPTGATGLVARWYIERISICLKIHHACVANQSELEHNNGVIIQPEFLDKMQDDRQKLMFFNSYLNNENNQLYFRIKDFIEKYNRDYIHERIMMIDEPIIRESLIREYHRIFGKASKNEEIDELRKRIFELENEKS